VVVIDGGLAGLRPSPHTEATLPEVIGVILMVIIGLNMALLAATWWIWRRHECEPDDRASGDAAPGDDRRG